MTATLTRRIKSYQCYKQCLAESCLLLLWSGSLLPISRNKDKLSASLLLPLPMFHCHFLSRFFRDILTRPPPVQRRQCTAPSALPVHRRRQCTTAMAKRPCPFNSLSSLGDNANLAEFIEQMQSLLSVEDIVGNVEGGVGSGDESRKEKKE